jgi:hypothetical protein
LIVEIDCSGFSFNSASHDVQVTTEFVAPLSGLRYPSKPGYYYLYIQTYDSSNSLISQYSDFIYIAGPPLESIKVTSLSKTANRYNIFSFELITKTALNAYNNANAGRIFIEFPTVDPLGTAFASDLGYTSTGDFVGCNFISGITAISGRLQCQLIKSEIVNGPA